jgi:hypothetical protein
MSNIELENLRTQALNTLRTRALTKKELAAKLNQDEKYVREVVWQLVNRQQVEFTQDWKIKAADLEAA